MAMNRRLMPARAGQRVLLALVAALALAPAAQAQGNDVRERLSRLERDLNMLQRQVYGGGYGEQRAPGARPNLAVHNEIRMQQLEGEMRRLTGRIEDTMNAIKELRQRVDALANAVGERSGKVAAASGAAAPSAAPPNQGPGPGTLAPPVHWRSPGAGLTPPRPAAAEQKNASSGEASTPPGSGMLPGGRALAEYSHAFGLLKAADYSGAARAMQAFLEAHPKDPLAGNAQYWLGETYYVRGRYDDAAAAFATGYKNYPHGAKAPDDLLKLAMSLARANRKQNACVAFAQLHQSFPHPGSAIAERARAEEKRLGC